MEHELTRMQVLPRMVWTALSDGRAEGFSEGWLDYTGLEYEASIGSGWQSAVHFEDLGRLLSIWEAIVQSGSQAEVAARLRRRDGMFEKFLFRLCPLPDSSGAVSRLCVLHSLVEDPIAEERTGEHQRRFEEMVDALPGLVWTATQDGSCNYTSKQWRDYAGITLDDVRWNRDWETDVIHPDDLARAQAFNRATFCPEGVPGDLELRLRRSDGEYRRFITRTSPVKDARGQVIGLCSINTDLEELKRAEEALLAHQLAAERVQASVALTTREEELKRANQYLTLAQQLSQTGSYARVVETDEQTLSEEMYRIYEFNPNEPVTHQMVLDRIHPDDLPSFVATQSAALAAGKDFDMTCRMVMPSGAVKHVRSFSQRLTETPDRLVYVGATQDITEWKLAEAALRANETELRSANYELLRAYRHIAEAQRLSNTGSFTLDFSVNELFWSEELYRIFELDPTTTITLDLVKSFVHPADIPAYVSAVEGATAGAEIDFAFRIITASNTTKYLRAVGHRIEQSGDRPVFVGATQDVTKSRLAEDALRQSEAFLSQGEVVGESGSFLWNLDSGEIRWSDQMYRIFQFELRSLITLDRIAARVHPDDLADMEEMITRAHAAVDSEYVHRILLDDGSMRWLHFVARSLQDEDGRLRYMGTVQDITDRKLAEEALDKVRSELTHAARAMSLGVLTASIAHEVNQPLTSLMTNASTCVRLLGADPPDVELARTIAQRTIRDANRASEVIKRLRGMFSRKRVVAEAVDLNEAAREVLALSGGALQAARVVPRLDFADELPKIRGDRVQLQQVILNLVLNAADAMGAIDDRPRHLWIKTSSGPDEVCLSVRDAGVGLEPQNLERLFDAFYTTKGEGMGIGLSISRTIIDGHAGRLWGVSNGDGPGATFSFTIPCRSVAADPISMDA
jgi:PAS domain S-box-containing protein